jgi:hypothetical protein
LCPLDVKAKNTLNDAYYTTWDGNKHLTTFGKRLNDDQHTLNRSNITMADKDKFQFYLEEMYISNHFDTNKMLDWELQTTAIKTDYKLINLLANH